MVRFIVEDSGHKMLFELFVPKGISIQKAGTITATPDKMQKAILKVETVVGVIDNDKRQPPYFNHFKEISHENSVILKQKFEKGKATNEFLIILKPAVEKFIVENIQQTDMKLPEKADNFNLFKDRMKSREVENDTEIIQFLRKLKKKNSNGFQTLENIINRFLAL